MENLDIIIPVALTDDGVTAESIIRDILYQHDKYGFTKFALFGPGKGWRSTNAPSLRYYEEIAHLFAIIRNTLIPHNIECGWWNTATIKCGPSKDFNLIVRSDGSTSPFGNCPLNPAFRRYFTSSIALFAKIASPSFIFFEDDYSIHASSSHGCFCKHHLDAFAKRRGTYYSREELINIFSSRTDEAYELLRAWRELMRDSMVLLSKEARIALDEVAPEIPMGYMQAGSADIDGDCTEAICRALAGPNHVPFSRLFGTFYNGGDTKNIPVMMYHPLYSKQHITGNFKFYHESDTYPHTRFYTSATQMRVIMSAAYSYGFDGSTFQTMQMLDDPNEDPAYGKMFAQEREKFNAVYRVAKQCKLCGVSVQFDPFWNTADDLHLKSCWVKSLSMLGVPYTTLETDISFWDVFQAKHKSHDEIMSALSKSLFLDGEAAKALCERGYSKYLGVSLGDNVADGKYMYDLCARSIIRNSFARDSVGRNMHPAHTFSCAGNGKLLKMTVTDPTCEIICDEYTFDGKYVSPSLTRYINSLGGKVVVLGMTVKDNGSQALLNYRFQRLLHELIIWSGDNIAFAKNDPGIYLIMNESMDSSCGFTGMLTLINLCEDELDTVKIHLPKKWLNVKEYRILDKNGVWIKANTTILSDEITIDHPLRYSDPMYILAV